MILLYVMSSIYHGLSNKRPSKKVFQILDHCSIYLLIAGTYTPMALCTIREVDTATGWWIFGIVWAIAILGIVLNSIDLKSTKKFSMICYLVMGWCIIVKFNVLLQGLHRIGLILLLAGGIAYTIGACFYGIGKKKKYMHSIFHMFVLAASILFFFSIFLYVI